MLMKLTPERDQMWISGCSGWSTGINLIACSSTWGSLFIVGLFALGIKRVQAAPGLKI